MAFSPDGRTLATGDHDGSIYLWDVATRSQAAFLTDRPRRIGVPGSGGILAVAFSPDGHIVAADDADGSTYLWHVRYRSAP